MRVLYVLGGDAGKSVLRAAYCVLRVESGRIYRVVRVVRYSSTTAPKGQVKASQR